MMQFMLEYNLKCCDSVLPTSYTYHRQSLDNYVFLDHFMCDAKLFQMLRKGIVLITGENLSDHIPIIVQFQHNLCISNVICDDDRKGKQCVRLRWDKADLVSYYYATYANVSGFSLHLFNCQLSCECDRKLYISWLHDAVVAGLVQAAELCIPKSPSNFYKFWWNENLAIL